MISAYDVRQRALIGLICPGAEQAGIQLCLEELLLTDHHENAIYICISFIFTCNLEVTVQYPGLGLRAPSLRLVRGAV